MTRSFRGVGALLGVVLLGVLAYGWTLRLGLIGADTIPLIVESRVEGFGELVDALTGPVMGGRNPVVEFYRPLSQALFVAEAALFGLDPVGYHVVGLLLHVLCGVATALLAFAWTGSVSIGALAGAILVIHPVGVVSIPFPSRLQDVLATLFGLLALLGHERVLARPTAPRWLLVGLLAALAMLAKESGLLFSGLVVLSHILRGTGTLARRAGTAVAWLLPILLPVLLLRFGALGGTGGYQGAFQVAMAPPQFHSPYYASQRTPGGLAATFLLGLLDPVRGLGSRGVFLPAAAVLILLALRDVRAHVAILLAWIGALLTAHLYLAFLHERSFPVLPWYLYLGIPAVAILLATALVRGVAPRARFWLWGMGGAAALVTGTQLLASPLLTPYPSLEVGSRLQDEYFDSLDGLLRVRSAETEVVTPGPMPWLVNSQRFFARGSMFFVGPWTIEAWLERFHPSVPAQVVSTRANSSVAGTISVRSEVEWVELDGAGRVADRVALSWQIGRPGPPKRVRLLERVVAAQPENVEAWLELGNLLRRLNSPERSEKALREALRLGPGLWQAHYALAQLYAKLGKLRRAEKQLEETLQWNPRFGPAERSLTLVREHLAALEDLGVKRKPTISGEAGEAP